MRSMLAEVQIDIHSPGQCKLHGLVRFEQNVRNKPTILKLKFSNNTQLRIYSDQDEETGYRHTN